MDDYLPSTEVKILHRLSVNPKGLGFNELWKMLDAGHEGPAKETLKGTLKKMCDEGKLKFERPRRGKKATITLSEGYAIVYDGLDRRVLKNALIVLAQIMSIYPILMRKYADRSDYVKWKILLIMIGQLVAECYQMNLELIARAAATAKMRKSYEKSVNAVIELDLAVTALFFNLKEALTQNMCRNIINSGSDFDENELKMSYEDIKALDNSFAEILDNNLTMQKPPDKDALTHVNLFSSDFINSLEDSCKLDKLVNEFIMKGYDMRVIFKEA